MEIIKHRYSDQFEANSREALIVLEYPQLTVNASNTGGSKLGYI